MIVGIITGTYSSVFIAAAIVSFWRGKGRRARRRTRRPPAAPRAGAQQPTAARPSRSARRARRKPRRAYCFEAALLGVVQGLTEFLPVSRSAHLLLGARLLGLDASDLGRVFDVMFQLGSILAVVVAAIRPDMRRCGVAAGPARRGRDGRGAFALMRLIVVGTVPARRRRRCCSPTSSRRCSTRARGDRGRVHRCGGDRDAGRRARRGRAPRRQDARRRAAGRRSASASCQALALVPGRVAVGRDDRRRRCCWGCDAAAAARVLVLPRRCRRCSRPFAHEGLLDCCRQA